MRAGWTALALAEACDGELFADREGGATGFAIDSREVTEGDLFIGIPGERTDGGSLAAAAVSAGAWGAVVAPEHAESVAAAGGAVIVHQDPVAALGLIAAQHRQSLNCKVIGVTGSSGKTSTKDILGAILSGAGPTVASRGNRNTEIGMPLEILRATEQTRFLVLEMAMRGAGQIAQLERIARPDVGVVVSIGPAHLDLLGSIEAIAAAKAELVAGLEPGASAVLPVGEALLTPHLREDLVTLRFGPGGDVQAVSADGRELVVRIGSDEFEVGVNFDQPHNRLNLLAALAAANAVGVRPPRNLEVSFSSLRGDRIAINREIMLIEDCYNSNPASLAAGLDDLAMEAGRRGGRCVAVLGDMLELGPLERDFHVKAGAEAERAGVDLLVTVGTLASAMTDGFGRATASFGTAAEAADSLAELLEDGDTVLVKGSRGVGLELVSRRLAEVS